MCDMRLHLEYDPENPVNPLEVIDEVRGTVCRSPGAGMEPISE